MKNSKRFEAKKAEMIAKGEIGTSEVKRQNIFKMFGEIFDFQLDLIIEGTRDHNIKIMYRWIQAITIAVCIASWYGVYVGLNSDITWIKVTLIFVLILGIFYQAFYFKVVNLKTWWKAMSSIWK